MLRQELLRGSIGWRRPLGKIRESVSRGFVEILFYTGANMGAGLMWSYIVRTHF